MNIDVNGTPMRARSLFTEVQIRARVTQLSQEINRTYPPDEVLVVLMVLHGALLFTADLVRGLAMPTVIESVRLKSYQGTQSTGRVDIVGDTLPASLAGCHVLVVEDIIDTGRSMETLLAHLEGAGAKSVRIATLLDKPEAHEVDIKADFIGFSIGRNFVIGYGLDLDGRYRNLPYVAELIKT